MPANLGLASNEEMMRELICRFKMELYNSGAGTISVNGSIDRALVLSEMLGGMSAPEREYRTVSQEDIPVTKNPVLPKAPKKEKKVYKPRASKQQREFRNARMIAMFEQGYSYNQIAAEADVSAAHVGQIIKTALNDNRIKSEPTLEQLLAEEEAFAQGG